MKYPPKIPASVGISLLVWVDGTDDLTKKELNDIEKFYASLKIKHNNTWYFRGLRISRDGAYDLFSTGKLDLRKRDSESWSCKYNIAKTFLPEDRSLKLRGSLGILMAKKIPANKVLFNLLEIEKMYYNVLEEDSIGIYFDEDGYAALESIERLNECELITKTVCTTCSIDDMRHIEFVYQNEYDDVIDGFLDMFDLDRKSKQKQNKMEFGDIVTITMYSDSWGLKLN